MSSLQQISMEVPLAAWQSVGFPAGIWRLDKKVVSFCEGKGKSRVTAGITQLSSDVGVENIVLVDNEIECPEISDDLGLCAIDHLMVRTNNARRTLHSLSEGLNVPITTNEHGEKSVWLDSVRIDMVPKSDLAVPAELWGIAFLVDDLGVVTDRLGCEVIGKPKPARQAGERVAVFRNAAGLGVPTALIDRRG
jgi:hypothetical protein